MTTTSPTAPVIEVAEEFVPSLQPFRVTELTVECDDAEELERIYNEYTAPGYILELDPSNPQADALELVSGETGFEVSVLEVEPAPYN